MRAIFLAPAVLAAALALSGCSDPAAYHVGEAEARAMAPPQQPVKQVADAGFCRDVAHQDAVSSFDSATRARFYASDYRQCMAVFGPPALRLADIGGDDARY